MTLRVAILVTGGIPVVMFYAIEDGKFWIVKLRSLADLAPVDDFMHLLPRSEDE